MVTAMQIRRRVRAKRARRQIQEPNAPLPPMTGAQAVAYWRTLSGGSVYADQTKYPGTSAQVARRLRDQEESRTHR